MHAGPRVFLLGRARGAVPTCRHVEPDQRSADLGGFAAFAVAGAIDPRPDPPGRGRGHRVRGPRCLPFRRELGVALGPSPRDRVRCLPGRWVRPRVEAPGQRDQLAHRGGWSGVRGGRVAELLRRIRGPGRAGRPPRRGRPRGHRGGDVGTHRGSLRPRSCCCCFRAAIFLRSGGGGSYGSWVAEWRWRFSGSSSPQDVQRARHLFREHCPAAPDPHGSYPDEVIT